MAILHLISPWLHVGRARDSYLAGDLDAAALALATVNLSRLSRSRRARALMLRSAVGAARGHGDQALADLEAAISLQPRPSVIREASATIHAHLSATGNHRAALKAVDLGLMAGADDQALLVARCESLAALGRGVEAEAGYRLILARDPRCIEATLGLALLSANLKDRAAEAARLCQRGLALSPPGVDLEPAHQRLLHTLCRAWLTLGEVDRCVAYFEEMPHEAGWVRAYGLAAGLAARGDTEKAVRELLFALHEDEDHPFVFQLLRELAGERLSPLPVWHLWVRLKWRGSHIPRIAAMLPPSVVRGYSVGAASAEDAARWIRETLPAGIFEADLTLLSVSEAKPLAEGHTGIIGMLAPDPEIPSAGEATG